MQTTLRLWRPEDAAELAAALDNPKIHANLRDGLPLPYTKADAAAFISAMLAAEQDSQYTWAIVADGHVAGSIGLFRGGNIHRCTAEMGYYVAEPYWGKGVATQAVSAACAFAFASTDLLRVHAEPFSDNAASRRVLEKAGFVLEGILRSNAIKNGAVRDMCMYARVRRSIQEG